MSVPVQLAWLREAFEVAISVAEKRAHALGAEDDEEKLRFWASLVQVLRRTRRLSGAEKRVLKEVVDVLADQEVSYFDVAYLMLLLAVTSTVSAREGYGYAAATKE